MRLLCFPTAAVIFGVALSAHAQQTTAPITPITSGQSTTFEERLTALELALSTIVAEQPNLWRFDPLGAEAASLLVEATTEADRQAVRALADRIERFDNLATRYQQLTKTPAPFQLTKAREATALNPGQTSLQSRSANKEYDAIGVLRPVVSKREDAPRFALVDGRGKVTTFVTPSPEIDLQPLVGKRIGVRGTRGFIPEYKRDHLTATRVTPLKTTLR